jgi:hypothetical protein
MGDKRRLLLAAATLAAMVAGACEKQVREARKPAEPSTAPKPVGVAAPVGESRTASAVIHPTTAPAETQPAPALITINGVDLPFPRTKLQLRESGKLVLAEMCSDLPKSALRGYDGNELYLEMTLDGVGADGTVDNASWRFKSAKSGKADSPNGIFLNGQTTHLQPDDVMVRFERRGDQLFALVMGQFRAFEAGTPDALAPFVPVRGELAVEMAPQR